MISTCLPIADMTPTAIEALRVFLSAVFLSSMLRPSWPFLPSLLISASAAISSCRLMGSIAARDSWAAANLSYQNFQLESFSSECPIWSWCLYLVIEQPRVSSWNQGFAVSDTDKVWTARCWPNKDRQFTMFVWILSVADPRQRTFQAWHIDCQSPRTQ